MDMKDGKENKRKDSYMYAHVHIVLPCGPGTRNTYFHSALRCPIRENLRRGRVHGGSTRMSFLADAQVEGAWSAKSRKVHSGTERCAVCN